MAIAFNGEKYRDEVVENLRKSHHQKLSVFEKRKKQNAQRWIEKTKNSPLAVDQQACFIKTCKKTESQILDTKIKDVQNSKENVKLCF
jgi:hypothetical protein